MTAFSFPTLYPTSLLSTLSFFAWLPLTIFLIIFITILIHNLATSIACPIDNSSNLKWNMGETLAGIFVNEGMLFFYSALIVIILPINLMCHHDAQKNRELEESRYKLAMAYSTTLQTELNLHPLDEDLRSYAENFNTGIQKMNTYSQNSKYKVNFTGNFDWGQITEIEIPTIKYTIAGESNET